MVRQFFEKYEKYLSIAAFLGGFTLDNLTLTRIDLWFDNLVLGGYLLLAGLAIFFFHFLKRKPPKGAFRRNIVAFLPIFLQFEFGGLFSGFFVFYSRSASLATSWIFALFLMALLIGNEFFKRRYARLEFQVSIFFVTLFSFSIFYVPILFDSIGAGIFLLSGVLSLIGIWFFLNILAAAIPQRIKQARKILTRIILFIYVTFNILYFTNIIPPIPLSMKEMSVDHFVERVGDDYHVTVEPVFWYEFGKKLFPEIHISEGEPVYVFSSVFAPTDLNTTIFHKWQRYDETTGRWIETDQFNYKIFGGRGAGYRGYSVKQSITPGKWRVDVVTERDQIIGRITFRVVPGAPERELKTETL